MSNAINHCRAAGAQGDQRSAGGEHDAEDQQDQRAADVDHQLHGAEEIGPGQEEQPGHGRERDHQVDGHPHDVGGGHHGDGPRAGHQGKEQEEDTVPVDCFHRHILTQLKTQLQRPPGKKNIQSMTPASMIEASGTQYFRQVVITWSMRSRGSVQRSHIMNITPT